MTLFSDRDERFAENLRIINSRFIRKKKEVVRGERISPPGGGGAPTVVIAASNSTQFSKDRADVQCTGTNDHLLIQQVLDGLDLFGGVGVRVLLCEGTFNFNMTGATTHALRFKGPTLLQGMGILSTTILLQAGSPSTSNLSVLHSFGQDVGIQDLAVVASTIAANPPNLIRTTNSASIERVFLQFAPLDAISIGGGGSLSTLHHVWISAPDRDGVSVTSSTVHARAVKVQQAFRHGFYTSSAAGSFISCEAQSSAENGFNLDGFVGDLIGCKTSLNTLAGVYGNGCEELNIRGGQFSGDDEYGINLEECAMSVIDGPIIRQASEAWSGNGAGIRLANCNQITISPSTFLSECWEDGIKVVDSSHCRILATVMGSGLSVDDTYDNVRVLGTVSPEDDVRYNLISVFSRPASEFSGETTRYGVSIESGYCNRVVGCDFGSPGDYGIDAINIAPDTSTQIFWPEDSHYGDNLISCGEPSVPDEVVGGPDDETPPAVPVWSTPAIEPGDTEIFLFWEDNEELDLASYKIYRATASGGPYTLLMTVTDLSEHVDTGLSNGTQLWYKISAVDATGNESAQSSAVTTTPAVPPAATPPPVPANLRVTDAGDGHVDLEWDPVFASDFSHYNVYYHTATGGPYTLFGTRTVPNASVTGLTNTTPYFFVVTSEDVTADESANSNEVTDTPTADAPAGGLPAADIIFDSGNPYSAAKVNAEAAGTVFQFTVTGGNGGGARYENAAIPVKAGNKYVFDPGTVLDGNGTVPLAFTGTAADVEIYDCEWTAYVGQNSGGNNNTKGGGGIRLRSGWQLIRPYGHHNKYTAVRFDGADALIQDGDLSYNGEFGFAGTGNNGEVNGTEVHHNGGAQGLDLRGDQGGCKIVHSNGFRFINVYAHDNYGSGGASSIGTQGGNGLWTDINNTNILYDGCVLENNRGAGIFHEVSLSFEIKNCTFENNGRDYAATNPGSLWPVSSQIQISNSGGNSGWIHDNTIVVDGSVAGLGFHGITLFNSGHFQWTNGVISNGCLGTRNILIENNTITMSGANWKSAIAITGNLPTARSSDQFCGQAQITATASNNRIRTNTESLSGGAFSSTPYIRAGVRVSAAQWAGFGYS